MGQFTARMADTLKRLLLEPGHGTEAGPDLLDLAYRNNWANVLVNLSAGSGLVGTLWFQSELSFGMTVWICVIFATTVIRLFIGYRYHVALALVPVVFLVLLDFSR